MNSPLISIIVPTFNRSHFLSTTLNSILNQKYQNFELIVVDDGSTDNTPEILKKYNNKLTIIRQENKGVSSARNLGITKAKGEYIAFCDSDDLWLPQKLNHQIKFFKTNPQAILCYTGEIWLRNGVRVNQCKHHKKSTGWLFEKCLKLCIVSPSSVMMHNTFFKNIGTFDETLPACEDYDLWLRGALKYKYYFIEKPLIQKQGGHIDQLSRKYWGMDRFRIKSIIKCLNDPQIDEHAGYREQAIEMLTKKCYILAAGARKRGKLEEAQKYEQLTKEWRLKL